MRRPGHHCLRGDDRARARAEMSGFPQFLCGVPQGASDLVLRGEAVARAAAYEPERRIPPPLTPPHKGEGDCRTLRSHQFAKVGACGGPPLRREGAWFAEFAPFLSLSFGEGR